METALNGDRQHEQDRLEQRLVHEGHISLDKSWMMRMGFMDLMQGSTRTVELLAPLAQKKLLGDDLMALYEASVCWLAGSPDIYVGESATLYRFLQFAAWKLEIEKNFILDGTLKDRPMAKDKGIVHWSQEKLLELNTSQYASAAALMGDKKRIENPPFKLKVTYDAIGHYEERKTSETGWGIRYDETLLKQAVAFLKALKTGVMEFKIGQAEDYCFARAFGLITKEEGLLLYKSLTGHETNRIEEMERALETASRIGVVDSLDHRVVQAVVMLYRFMGKPIEVVHPEAVNKSWPEFPRFIADAPQLARAAIC